jgi:hypothetical protein
MVVKFINVHPPHPRSMSGNYLLLSIGKQSKRPRLFRSAPGIGFAQL